MPRHHDPDPIDDAARSYRRRLGDAPPAVIDAAVSAFRASAEERGARGRWDVARFALLLAGIAGAALNGAVLVGDLGHAGQDLVALHLAISTGFLVAAWRPARYATGMAPVAAAAAALLFLPTASDTTVFSQQIIGELAHLPILLGAAALLLGRWRPRALRRPDR